MPKVEASECCRVVSRPSSIVEYLHLPADDRRFADRRVREAIHLAIDRDALVRLAWSGHAQPASQMVVPGVFGFDPTIPVQRRDLARARQLLAEAGYPDGFDVTLDFRTGRRGEDLQRQLGELGLRVSLRSAPFPDLFPRLNRGEVPFYYGGVAAPTADASDILDSFAHTLEPARGYGITNFNRYSNPRLDALIEQSAAVLELRERRALLQRCVGMLTADLYAIPLVVLNDVYGIRHAIAWQPRLDKMLLGREMKPAE